MKRSQVFILMIMAGLVLVLCAAVAVVSRSFLTGTDTVAQKADISALENATAQVATPKHIRTATFTPTSTPVPTETNTPAPTPTGTRVVLDTATPTPSGTPTPAPTATATLVVSGGGYSGGYRATATPSWKYHFHVTQGPVAYSTTNHWLVVLAQLTENGLPAAGYKLVGTHHPTGAEAQSDVSCPNLCKASGVEAVTDDSGNIVKFQIQKGNVQFETQTYDTGTWTLMVVDGNGKQASDAIEIAINSDDPQWFYYTFSN